METNALSYDMTTVGKRLEAARVASGLSMRQVAERFGMTHQAVSKWEKGGHLDVVRLMTLANLYKVSPLWIMCGIGAMKLWNSGSVNAEIPVTSDEINLLNLYRGMPESKRNAIFAMMN